MKRRILLVVFVLSFMFSGYLFYETHGTVVRWQKKANDRTLVWVTENPYFIAFKLWLEMTHNVYAVLIIFGTGYQLFRRRKED